MASEDVLKEYADVLSACTAILVKNQSHTPITTDEWEELTTKIDAATTLTNEAFAGATNCVVSSNIANKEMFDFVSSMSRFLEVYDEDRLMYYDDAEAYYTPHINMLNQQKAVFTQLFTKGDAIINGS